MDWDDVSGAEQLIEHMKVTAHGIWLLAGIVVSVGADGSRPWFLRRAPETRMGEGADQATNARDRLGGETQ